MGRLVACGWPEIRSSPGRKESDKQEGVRTAEKLLLESCPHTAWGQSQLQLLQGLCLLATGEQANVETALGAFINIAQAEVPWLAEEGGGGQGRLKIPAQRPASCLICRRTASPRSWP